jgi:PAS domain S-box-containing protein
MAIADDPPDASSAAPALLASLGGATWEFDPHAGRFTAMSDAAAALLGATAEAWPAAGYWAARLHPDDRAATLAARDAAVRDGRPHVLEYRCLDASGHVVWMRDAAVVTGASGARRLHGAWLDLSRERRAERGLRRTREELADVRRLTRVRSLAWDIASDHVTLSPVPDHAEAGDEPTTMAQLLLRVHADDADRVRRELAAALTTSGEPFTLDYRLTPLQGPPLYLELTGRVLRDGQGQAVRMLATVRDVTEQRAAGQAIAEHVRFLESLDAVNRAIQGAETPEALLDAVLVTALDIFDADRAWFAARRETSSHWAIESAACRPQFPGAARGHVVPGLESFFQAAFTKGLPLRVGEGGDAPLPAATAERFQVQAVVGIALAPAGHGPYVLALHHCRPGHRWRSNEDRLLVEVGRRLSDALTVSLTHQALQRSERYLAEAQRVAQLGHWERDFEHGTHEASAETARILGLTEEEARQHSLEQREAQWRARIHPDDLPAVRQATERALAGTQPYDVVYRIVRPPNGEIRHVRSAGDITRDASGQPQRWFGTLQDITERVQAEQAARESHALLGAVFDGSTDAISVKDAQGRFLIANRAFADLRDTTVDELVGTLDTPAGHAGLDADELGVLTSGEPVSVEDTLVIRGAPRTLHSVTFPYFDDAGTPIGLIRVSRDTTERRHLEEGLRQAQKMEAVGRLAGGVAHNFNNLLTVILGYAEVIGLGLPAGDPNLGAIEEIVKGAERAASMTRQLMAFSRTQPVTPRVVDVGAVLTDLHALLRPLIAEDIDMTVHVDDGLGTVVMDQGQFEQAVTNLVVNASDAMPGGGRLRIEALNTSVEAGGDVPGLARPGAYVEVRVWDSGRGMDDATRGRIFEPFFTTKPTGAGTGLGLSMVYGFVTQLGGHIDVTTRPGAGSLFRLLLPRSAEPATGAGRALAGSGNGHETILLVEDEEAVRRVARLVLTSRGYRVFEARDGVEALALAREREGQIDLLLSDLVMPRMNGQQLAEQIALAYPAVKVLLMSGYPDRVVPTGVATDPRFEFLSKPFQPSTLARRVRECLDRDVPRAPRR